MQVKKGRKKVIYTNFFQIAAKPRFVILIALLMCWDTTHSTLTGKDASNESETKFPEKRSLKIDSLNSFFNHQPKQLKSAANSEEDSAIGPFLGNGVAITDNVKKRNCGVSTIAARTYLRKRSYFANTPDEVEAKREEDSRQKREIKRSEFSADGPLPWTCETAYEWRDMGLDHYPRFVRTAECRSRYCFNGFFRCKPRRYQTKVLRRLTEAEAASCEVDDVSLPESLREQWKFVTVTINLCCDCTGRVPLPET